ncbi:MAG TPA: signal peptidase II [Candidatus Moranbacteria bacterium]|nr:signal peptidase II [Candidatus Moranbacteria bacterium]HRY27564.1 signal peptidase II [Candidatus Moranbacteria bacterium]HSA07793.1 signal peptidase II [Candidatus Moranbacteria bacterium]
MFKSLKNSYFLKGGAFLGLFIIIIDQLFKYKIRQSGGFYLCNSGISFGIQLPIPAFWLILGLFLLLLVIYFIFFHKQAFSQNFLFLGLSLIMGGALSNISDRFFFGCVLDYISIFKNFFPIFNVADVGISSGLLFILFSLTRKAPEIC